MKLISERMEEIKNMMKEKATISSVTYLAALSGIFVILCLIMGNPKWIFTIFFGTVFESISDDAPRMFASVYSARLENIDRNQLNELLLSVATSVTSAIPMAVQFTCIDNIVQKYVDDSNRKSKFLIFLASYMLQALITISWASPVSWDTFMNKGGILGKLLVPLCLAAVFGPIIYSVVKNVELSDNTIFKSLSVPISLIVKFLQELIKVNIILLPFGMILGIVSVVLSIIKLGFIAGIIGFFAPFVYVWVNNMFGDKIDTITDKIVKLIFKIADPKFDYQESSYSEVFCALISVLVMLVCFGLYFKLT